MYKKLIRSAILFAAMIPIASCSQSPSTSQQLCKPWAEISRGEYLLTNNVWGSKGQTNYRQCVSLDQHNGETSYGWEWKWPGRNGQVIAYPSILFGFKPWNKASTTSKLPLQIAEIKKIQVNYDLQQQGEGSHNVLLESWVSSSARPVAETRTAEIAIHLSQHNWPGMPGKLIDTVEIDGGRYDFYVDPRIVVPGDSHHWAYLGFVNTEPYKQRGSVDMAAFVRFLQAGGYLDISHYLVSVELGSELVKGSGKTQVKTFSVQF